jgi:hypothetical protein
MARQPANKKGEIQKTATKATPRLPKNTAHKPLVTTVYESRCSWSECDLAELLNFSDQTVIGPVIISERERKISFDWIGPDHKPVQHTRLLTTDGVRYEGYTTEPPSQVADRARVEATLYSNSLGHILVGQGVWEEDRRCESFIIQLHSGQERVEDE